MHLMDQRLLNFNHPVNKYIPEYSGWNTENKYGQIRLIKDLFIDTAECAPSIEFYNPIRVSSDL